MKMLIAAGGTGGHIYPGVAVAREFLSRDSANEVVFVGTARGLETTIVPREGFALELIEAGALKSVSLGRRLASLARLPKGFVDALRILRRHRPAVVIGAGGYASGPILLVAALLRYPTLVVEPNAMPGFTNRTLARFVGAAAVTFEESLAWFRRRGVVTGNPVRSDFASLAKKARGERLHLLVFGGSQGSRALNTAVVAALPRLAEAVRAGRLAITHQTGPRELEQVSAAYAAAGVEADVRPFIERMMDAFGAADVLLCRSGATTVAEVAVAGKAAIFVPFPQAADDHQRRNAEAFVRAGAGRMVLERDLTGDRVADEIFELIEHPDEIDRMETASRGLARADAAERTVDLALSLIERA
jgi:UDP-N-acetylglucosamine--N-acetylmuramyl-(pentapeptide) pyrophosphoryl-undecaprenol N-acetylglucosamine transferase